MRAYHSGQPKALTKSKELSVYQALQAAGIEELARNAKTSHAPWKAAHNSATVSAQPECF